MVFLPPGVSFCARKLEMSVACCIRSLLRALTDAATEAKRARCELFRLRYRRALVLTYQVEAGTIRILGSGGAVGSQEHARVRAVRVASLRTRAQKARHNVDTRSPFNFCHSLLAITRATSGKALVVALRNALALSSDYPQSSLVNLSESPSKPDERE